MGFAKGEISQLTNSMLKLGFSAGLPGVACPALVIRGERTGRIKSRRKPGEGPGPTRSACYWERAMR